MRQRQAETPFSDLYGRLADELTEGLRESHPPYGEAHRSIREEVVRCLWFGGHFAPEQLATDDGRKLEVLSPGWWNVEGGPDFIRAEFLLEGAGRVVGNVEVHTVASDWYGHGHDRQPEYDDVALHVVMWNDAPDRAILLHSGTAVPQLTLSRFVEEELNELVEIVDMEGEPGGPPQEGAPRRYCGEALASGELSPRWVGRLLDIAGDHRLLSKAERLARRRESLPLEQILYECVAEALGYRNNRMPFLQLAELLPVRTLRRVVPLDAPPAERQRALEAAMYGASGFLEHAPEGSDEQTRAYLRDLRARWEELPSEMRRMRMAPEHWSFASTRPVNYPTRRIAALAALYAQHLSGGLFGHVAHLVRTAQPGRRGRLDAALRRALTAVFTDLTHPYWARRCRFGPPSLARPRALIGRERATSLMVDVLLPLLLVKAREAQDEELGRRVELLWSGLPRRAPNAVVRRMCLVMFGGEKQASAVVHSARRQQGLHQLYNDACSTPDGCACCVLYLASRAGKDLAEV